MNPNGILVLKDSDWLNDYCDQKYYLIHLSIRSHDISSVDLFMLAASRLFSQGEFVIRVEQKSADLLCDLVTTASYFEFKLVSNNKATNQYVFRFEGRETKLGFQMARSHTYSDLCISLFKSSFGATIPDEFWHWKYPKDKTVSSVVALKHNKAVAHYGLCDRDAIYDGCAYGFSQASDVMVAPGERGAIASSVFYELVQLGEKPFYARDSSVSVIYGFPHGRHYKLGARLKLYEPISPIMNVFFKIPSMSPEDFKCVPSAELFEASAELESNINSALQRMFSVENVLLLQRNYRYFLHRYVFHPVFKYDLYCFANCYFIIKIDNEKIFLMDYFGELSAYAENLEGFILALSEKYSGFEFQIWCLKDISISFSSPDKIVDTGAVFVCKKYTSSLPDFKRWWITMGDTEFL